MHVDDVLAATSFVQIVNVLRDENHVVQTVLRVWLRPHALDLVQLRSIDGGVIDKNAKPGEDRLAMHGVWPRPQCDYFPTSHRCPETFESQIRPKCPLRSGPPPVSLA